MKRVEEIHNGIVLRWCSRTSQRCWVFDREMGKTCCAVKGPMPVVGAHIQFYVSRQGEWGVAIYGVTTLDIPLSLAATNIALLHHVLELCFYSLAPHNPVSQAYDLLMLLYGVAEGRRDTWWVKMFLFKLMISLGVYNSHAPFSMPVFYRLSIESIDSLVSSALHLEIERHVDDWLCSCVGAHPYFGDFKTVQFLTNLRVP